MKVLDDRYDYIRRRYVELRKQTEPYSDDDLIEIYNLAKELHTYRSVSVATQIKDLLEPSVGFISLSSVDINLAPVRTYSDKLRDPRWQKKRLLIFQRDDWACLDCGSKTRNLQIHHLRYFSNTEPWDYPNELLQTLCEVCHGAVSGTTRPEGA